MPLPTRPTSSGNNSGVPRKPGGGTSLPKPPVANKPSLPLPKSPISSVEPEAEEFDYEVDEDVETTVEHDEDDDFSEYFNNNNDHNEIVVNEYDDEDDETFSQLINDDSSSEDDDEDVEDWDDEEEPEPVQSKKVPQKSTSAGRSKSSAAKSKAVINKNFEFEEDHSDDDDDSDYDYDDKEKKTKARAVAKKDKRGQNVFVDEKSKKLVPFGGGKTKIKVDRMDNRVNQKRKALMIQVTVLALFAGIFLTNIVRAVRTPEVVTEQQIGTYARNWTQWVNRDELNVAAAEDFARQFIIAYVTNDGTDISQSILKAFYSNNIVSGQTSTNVSIPNRNISGDFRSEIALGPIIAATEYMPGNRSIQFTIGVMMKLTQVFPPIITTDAEGQEVSTPVPSTSSLEWWWFNVGVINNLTATSRGFVISPKSPTLTTAPSAIQFDPNDWIDRITPLSGAEFNIVNATGTEGERVNLVRTQIQQYITTLLDNNINALDATLIDPKLSPDTINGLQPGQNRDSEFLRRNRVTCWLNCDGLSRFSLAENGIEIIDLRQGRDGWAGKYRAEVRITLNRKLPNDTTMSMSGVYIITLYESDRRVYDFVVRPNAIDQY